MLKRLLYPGVMLLTLATAWTACVVEDTSSDDDDTSSAAGAGGTTGAQTAAPASVTGAGTTTASSSTTTGPSTTASSVASSSASGGGMVTIECNPVTNDKCNTAGGQACDGSYGANGFSGFQCYDPPNEQQICDTCDGNNGPWCAGSMTCGAGNKCVRWCCSDADCGASGTCDKKAFEPIAELGHCVGGGTGSGGAGGAGGAGGGSPDPNGPDCDVPAFDMAPSMGSCVTVP